MGCVRMNTILLVGHIKEVDEMTSRLLKRNGYRVQVLQDEKDSINMNPDLIIMDCDLTPKEGFERYKSVIQNLLPVQILWISSNPDDEINALEFGADDWIKKPFHLEILLARIQKLCKKSAKFS